MRSPTAGRLSAVFGNLVPGDLYDRRSKASSNRAFFASHSRALAEEWSGEGVDDRELVDAEVLRAERTKPAFDGRTFTLMLSIWLARFERASTEARREQLVGFAGDDQRRGRRRSTAS